MRVALSNWRIWLMLTHRWMGIAIGLMFVAWVVSGIVLLYAELPHLGQLLKLEALDRANRWGYYGLHGLDFAFLYERRPLWDIVVATLLLGVGVVSVTTLLPMLRRLKRHALRIATRFAGRSALPRRTV